MNVTERTSVGKKSLYEKEEAEEDGEEEEREHGLYLSFFMRNNPNVLKTTEVDFLGVEGLHFHWLAEHCHGEDQAQDLQN